jgi:CRP-like cAMP-binding protein
MNQIRPNSLLATLNEAAEPALFNNLNRFSAERHTVLQRAGEPTGHVYFPIAGMVSFLTVMGNGEAVETAAVGFDNMCGHNTALSGRNSNCQLIVQLDMQAHRINTQHFQKAYQQSDAVRHTRPL